MPAAGTGYCAGRMRLLEVIDLADMIGIIPPCRGWPPFIVALAVATSALSARGLKYDNLPKGQRS
jgi:hypothetical protein